MSTDDLSKKHVWPGLADYLTISLELEDPRQQPDGQVDRLLPCPFCGSKNVGVFGGPKHMREWNTGCHDCSAAGPYTDISEQAAVDNWNTRAK